MVATMRPFGIFSLPTGGRLLPSAKPEPVRADRSRRTLSELIIVAFAALR